MPSYYQNLESLATILLDPAPDGRAILDTCKAMKELFCEAVDFDETEKISRQRIRTKSGMALDPDSAASCLDDMMRTRKFILGIRDAISERLRQDPVRPVTVLYAGTGPFASLLTPLITVFSPAKMQLVLLEINPASFHYLQKMISCFEMERYVINLVQADATTHCITGSQQPDIIVSETMNNALRKEPQVAIVANLIPQCNRNPLLIPRSIRVDACLAGNTGIDPGAFIVLKTLLDLDAPTSGMIGNDPMSVTVLSKGIEITIPETPGELYDRIVLRTSIHIFGKHKLLENESGLTIPHIVMMKGDSFQERDKLLFRYIMGADPGFTVSRVKRDDE